MTVTGLLIRIGFAASLVISAASHAYLYVHGYRHIPDIGAAFVLSRTGGVLGFSELGWDPAPHAALSVGAEVLTVLLWAAGLIRWVRTSRRYPARSEFQRGHGQTTSA